MQGEGPGRVKQYFFCSLLHKWNSIRKEETQAQPKSALKKTLQERNIFPHPYQINEINGSSPNAEVQNVLSRTQRGKGGRR